MNNKTNNGADKNVINNEVDTYVPPTPRQEMFKRFKSHRSFQFGLFILISIVLMALFAPLLAPYDPYLQDYQ